MADLRAPHQDAGARRRRYRGRRGPHRPAGLGIALSALTGQTVYAGCASLLIGTLRCLVAVRLAREMHDLVVGEAALPEVSNQIRAAIDAPPGTSQVLDLCTMHPGPEEVLVAAKVEMDPSASQIARVIDDAERRVRGLVPIARVVYLDEPKLSAQTSGPAGLP